jgi:hypothetical protein
MSSDPDQAYGWSYTHESDLNRLKGVQTKKISVSAEEAEIWFHVVLL